VPPLAEGFGSRPETAPGLAAALVPGALVALIPASAGGAAAAPGRPESGGKTQLAAFLASSLWESGDIDLLFWVQASSRASVLSGYVQAAAAAGMTSSGTAESVAARFTGWLSASSRPWLLVLDDVADAADLDGLWPDSPAGRVVITTPDEQVGYAERRALVLPVGPLSTREALNFLVGRLSADPDQRHGAIDLAGDLGCEPAALAQAGAMIASSRLSCRDYQQHFARRRDELARSADGERPAAAVTWTLSIEQAERLSPGGTVHLVLALAALLAGDGIPATVFTSPAACGYLPDRTRPEQAWDAVTSLRRTGLITIDASVTPPVVRMSRTLAEQVRAAMPEWMQDRAVPAAAAALLEAWPPDEPQPWLAASLRSCADSLRRAAGSRLWTEAGCHPLLLRAGRSLDGARLTGPAVSYWTDLAAASDRILGPDNADTLTAGSHLARALLATGQSAEAVAWSQWVVARRTRMLGPDHPATISARVRLGHAMLAASRADPAVAVLREALGDCERVRGADHHRTLEAREELAAAYQAAGQASDAMAHYRRALADRERLQGPRHPAALASREKLASATLADGRVKDALALYKQALADRERTGGPDHPDTIAVRAASAAAWQAAGKMGSALQLHEQACAGYARVLGRDHPRTLAGRAALAAAYHAAGRLTDATALLRDTLTRCERVLPAADPLTLSLRQGMAEMAGG
jgi:tetratricopeptide (TPR) repeat protein